MPARTLCSLTILLFLINATTVLAQPADATKQWQTAFTSAALASQFDVRGKTLLIVGAGTASADLHAATAVLKLAYRQLPGVGPVIDAAGLPALGRLDDHAIIRAAKARPFDHLVIVRLFPDGDGNLNTAVVTVYGPGGEAEHAFTATAGVPLEASGDSSHSARGVTRRAAETISELNEEQQEGAEDAQAAYAKGFIVIPELYPGRLPSTFAYQGNQRRALSGADFYRALGRDDLAKRYTSANVLRWGLTIGGSVVAFAAIMAASSTLSACVDDPNYGACKEDATDRSTAWSIVSLVGLTAALGFLINPHPVSAAKANLLVVDHNTKLRKRLRLRKGYGEQPLSTDSPQVLVTPYVSPSGAGMVLRVAF